MVPTPISLGSSRLLTHPPNLGVAIAIDPFTTVYPPLKTNSQFAPENGWLQVGMAYFQGRLLLVSGGAGIPYELPESTRSPGPEIKVDKGSHGRRKYLNIYIYIYPKNVRVKQTFQVESFRVLSYLQII